MQKCVTCLWDLPVFGGLSMDEFKNVCTNASKSKLKKGAYLFHCEDISDTVYLIKEGAVKLVQYTEEGKEIILDVVGRGEVLGETALFNKQKNLCDAVALEKLSVCSFSLEQFEELIKERPNLSLGIISRLGEKLYSTMQQLGDAANHSAESKLLALFFRLAKEYGEETTIGQLIKLNIPQEDIANMIGTSRVTVSRLINQFIDRDFLSREGKYYLIKDKCLANNFKDGNRLMSY